MQWGDFPTWISSIATSLALVGAAVAARVAYKVHGIESNRDKNHEEFTRRAQAAVISAWWGRDPTGTPDRWGIFVRNASNAPVYQAHLEVHGGGARLSCPTLGLPVVPPGETEVFHAIDTVLPNPADRYARHALADCQVALTFTDAVGTRWQRDRYGRLALEPRRELRIWGPPEAGDILDGFAADSLARYNVQIDCDTGTIGAELQSKFLRAAPPPDILIAPHDWLGELVERRCLDPVTLPDVYRDVFAPATIEAITYAGRPYSLPASLDTVALVRNTRLVRTAPETMDELLEIGDLLRRRRTGVDEILAVPVGAAGDPFHIWPLLSSAGAWLFGYADDRWDPRVNGIGTPETTAAFERLRGLGLDGVIRPDIEHGKAFELFVSGRTAFLLTTFGPVAKAMRLGIDLAVSAVPRFRDGADALPFVAVNGFQIAGGGTNRSVATEFVSDYFTRAAVVRAMDSLGTLLPPGAEGVAETQRIFLELCKQGRPMPSFPRMRQVWRELAKAELDLLSGADAATVARITAREIDRYLD
ncbi:sugar ABC transporter substrate-binding protein [Nocardia vulneris]|uniref:Extracellular solute-binding protein n=1 Tax=Nocardia vulneris TaxID=1141657 RepID=A0ABR4ZIG2_9NOCA|nr:extracellular solute-binding protein [Nocardia vulneris]KIA64970.1 hypothetical protein FG87_10335 [Nocardia vulneris]